MATDDDDLLAFDDDLLDFGLDDMDEEDLLAWNLEEETLYPVSDTDLDAANPNDYIDEVKRLRKYGDPKRYDSTVEKLNLKASEEFLYWLKRYNKSPDYINRLLSCTAVNYMRVHARQMEVRSVDNAVLVTGEVVGATPEGDKVKLLFPVDFYANGKYLNCKHLACMGAYWFDVETKGCLNPDIPFLLAASN